ncbi:MAG: DUF2764 family protein [Bacteroidaceae bacterium]|nr:DUF2764 family protein [Bacteroidaceae bacterium]
MGNYYCLMAGLPDLNPDEQQPGYSFADLQEECSETLTDADKKELFYFFLRYDCRNIVRLLKNPAAETEPFGNLSREQYEDLLTSARELTFNVHRYPAFMSIFAREFPYNKDTEGYFPEDEMLLQYIEYCIANCKSKVMREWFQLELDITNMLTAMLARKQGWALGQYVKGEGELQTMIRENKSKDFDLGLVYDFAKEVVKIVDESDPVKKERMIDALKWLWLDEQVFLDPFCFDAVFAYFAKLEIQNRWAKLDVETGKETFRQIIDDLRGEARVPDEFKAPTPAGGYNKSER